jgi:chaperone modulatory protein CbpM
MTDELTSLLAGEVLDDEAELSLTDLCRVCGLRAQELYELVDEGILDPIGVDPTHWRFRGIGMKRVRFALQLRQDLGVNWAGAALALDLLDELQLLRARLHRLQE